MVSIIRWNRARAARTHAGERMAPNVHAINRWCVGVLRYRASAAEGVMIIIEFRSLLAEYCEICPERERVSFEIEYIYVRTTRKDFNRQILLFFVPISSDGDSFCMSMRKLAWTLPPVNTWRNSIAKPYRRQIVSYVFRFVSPPTGECQMFGKEREREKEKEMDVTMKATR